ncbi:TonB-dependent receptor [Arachidicoccus sp.]|uniref:TonB-dependent receptor n=1 Tax=Arachidicoccus sp. TaxID=1872624 RepID=UPI003D1E77BA
MSKVNCFGRNFFYTCCFIFSVSVCKVSAQDTANHRVHGMVLDAISGTPLGGATIKFYKNKAGIVIAKDGKFNLVLSKKVAQFITSYSGYKNDTSYVPRDSTTLLLYLQPLSNLKDVYVKSKPNSTSISLMGAMKMEKIGQGELLRAACCNLSESFETTPSVDVGYTDAVSGYKQIEMLGLSGTNTAFTRENIPTSRGLASITGLTFMPGTWLEGIQLSKGTGSVVNGYEGVAGQINTELIKPFMPDMPLMANKYKLILNGYQSTQGRSEGNLVYNHHFKKGLSSNLFLYGRSDWRRIDDNKDGFMDSPIGTVLVGANRWFYFGPKGWEFQAGIKGDYLKSTGGQLNYKRNENDGLWGYQNDINRAEGWAKIGKVYVDKPYQSMGLQLSGVYHQQKSLYGARNYDAKEHSFYANYIFQSRLFHSDDNVIKFGSSFELDNYDEKYVNTDFSRREVVPGIFTEYSYSYLTKLNVVAGLRVDHHNLFGTFVTPRLHIRYALTNMTSLRLSIGRAQRTANILSENAGLLASSRSLEIDGKPISTFGGNVYPFNPETSWNMGVNLTQKFKLNYEEGTFSVDYYYTDFKNQVIADFETPGAVNFYNLQGKSYAHSFQAQLDYEPIHNFNVRLAYRLYDVKAMYDHTLKAKPFVANNRGFVNLNYATKNNWSINYTTQWTGKKRLPQSFEYGEKYSPSFLTMNMQINKSLMNDALNIYVGVENLTNYRQNPLILDAANPFGSHFDASQVWGPVMGRNIYIGFKWKI